MVTVTHVKSSTSGEDSTTSRVKSADAGPRPLSTATVKLHSPGVSTVAEAS